MIEFLIATSFVVSFVPVLILAVLYGVKTEWRATDTGRSIFYLFATTAVSYGLSVLVLVTSWLDGVWGDWIRIVTRFVIGIVLLNVLRIFVKAQHSGTVELD